MSPNLTKMSTSLDGGAFGGLTMDETPHSSCIIRAVLSGYESNVVHIDGMNAFSNPTLPTLALSRGGSQPSVGYLFGDRSASCIGAMGQG